MKAPVTGVILAGGGSRRMGSNKAFLELGGRPMIAIVAERLRAVAQEVIIAADDTHLYLPYADRCVPDQFPGVGTLGGIHAGLSAASHELTLAVGCDMPFIDPEVSGWFVEAARVKPGADVVILRRGEWVEPLHAVYRKSCQRPIEEAIRAGRRRVIAFFDQVLVRYVAPAEIAHLDGELKSFHNLNTPEEWQQLLEGEGRGRRAAGRDSA
jgi:molybdopterin-guanine dinucleotide biosynthesis protein A